MNETNVVSRHIAVSTDPDCQPVDQQPQCANRESKLFPKNTLDESENGLPSGKQTYNWEINYK